jgi:hypothetical protein
MLDRQISKISFFAEYSFITFLNLSAVISPFVVEQRVHLLYYDLLLRVLELLVVFVIQIVEVVMDSREYLYV